MLSLLVILILSAIAAFLIVFRKAYLIKTETVSSESVEGFSCGVCQIHLVGSFFERFSKVVNHIKFYLTDYFKNKSDRFFDFLTAKGHNLSAFTAKKFIKLSNFIQGKRVIRNQGKTSLFIRDIADYRNPSQEQK